HGLTTLSAARHRGRLGYMSVRPCCCKSPTSDYNVLIFYNSSNEASDGNATKRLLKFAVLRSFQKIESLATAAEFVRRFLLAIVQRVVTQHTSPATLDFVTEGT
ncbi:MAG: hypothetical protein ABI134_28500, partial [Byssovorax sp.]